MQVNLNTNINQSRPQFGKLKAIEFSHGIDGSVLRNNFPARKKLLEICELPIIKKIFEKYDGKICFTLAERIDRDPNAYPRRQLCQYANCDIVLESNKSEMEKIKKTYINKALEEIGDCDNFEKVYKHENVYFDFAEVVTKDEQPMNAVEKLINKIKSYNTPKLNKIEKEYATKSSQYLEWYEDECKHHYNRITVSRGNVGSNEERIEFVSKINELLGNK